MSTPKTLIPPAVSARIHWLRLPLILGVIIAHAGNDITTQPAAAGWAAFFTQLISGVWARSPVSLLFLISGYLFFYNYFPTWQTYSAKLARRLRSLLIPYVFWNFANLLFLIALQTLPFFGGFLTGSRKLVVDYTLWDTLDAFIGFSGTPVAYPFWYLRDLLIMVALAPVFYVLAKRLPWLAGAAFYLYWFFSPDPVVLLTPRSLLCFYLGAVLAVHRLDLGWLERWRTWLLGGYLLISVVDAAVVPQNQYLHHAVMTLGLPALWVFAGYFDNSSHPATSAISLREKFGVSEHFRLFPSPLGRGAGVREHFRLFPSPSGRGWRRALPLATRATRVRDDLEFGAPSASPSPPTNRLTGFLDRYAPGAFFVFAVHEPLLTILRKLLFRIIPPTGGWQISLVFLLVILLTSTISLAAWRLSMRLAPRFTRLVSGGR